MAKLIFDQAPERKYENGVDHAVLYTLGANDKWSGVVWNGMTSIDTAPDGGETEPLWADNIKYAVMRGAVSYAATINCYNYPEAFNACLGNKKVTIGGKDVYIHEQMGENFRLVYRTALNNAEKGLYGYRYHVVYGLACNPSDMTYETIDDSPDAVEFGFDVEGSPAQLTVGADVYSACEFTFDVELKNIATDTRIAKLYGSADADAECPDPDDLFTAA